jgi:hypothetical protein
VLFTVTTAGGTTAASDRLTSDIYSRGAGQCTWEVARQRLLAGLPIPPTAYPSSRVGITASYVPRQYDVLFWDTKHTAIITSKVTASTSAGTTTYSFTITERNALFDEKQSTKPVTFAVQAGKVKQAILSRASSSSPLNSFWR